MYPTHWYELELQVVNPVVIENSNWYNIDSQLSDENAGFDLYSCQNANIKNNSILIPFGVIARLLRVDSDTKTDSHFFLMPRSSIYKSGLIMANSTGVIDKSYRGELKAPVWSITGTSVINIGDRLFQIIAPDMGWIRYVRIVDSLPTTQRGENGFGSSGK